MKFKELILKDRDIELVTDWNSYRERQFDYYVEELTTADGYSVYTISRKSGTIEDISTELYYDEYGLQDGLEEIIKTESFVTIYVDYTDIVDDIDWEVMAEELGYPIEDEDEEE